MRPGNCAACQLPRPDKNQPDPCLGTLPDTKYACCGHGFFDPAYHVNADETKITRGRDAHRAMVERGGTPPHMFDVRWQAGLEPEERWPIS